MNNTILISANELRVGDMIHNQGKVQHIRDMGNHYRVMFLDYTEEFAGKSSKVRIVADTPVRRRMELAHSMVLAAAERVAGIYPVYNASTDVY